MTKIIYHIISHRGKWYIESNDNTSEEFRNKGDAIRTAYSEMKKNIQSGKDAQILIHEKGREWKVKCNFNVNDIFPFSKFNFHRMHFNRIRAA